MFQNTPKAPQKSIFLILGETVGLYLKSLKFLAVAVILAFVPVFILRMFLVGDIQEQFTIAYDGLADRLQDYFAGNIDIATVVGEPLSGAALNYALLFYGIELAFLPLLIAAATFIASRFVKNESASFGEMFNEVMPKFPKMLITTAIVSVMLFFMFGFLSGFFIIIPIYFGVGIVFFNNVTADSGRWGLNAISISRFLVRGRWFSTFFITVFFLVAYFVVATMIDIAISAFGLDSSVFIHLPVFLIRHLILAFFILAFALWYFARKAIYQQQIDEMERKLLEMFKMEFGETPNKKDDDTN